MGSQRIGHNWTTELTNWYISPGPIELSSHPHPHPTPLGHHRALMMVVYICHTWCVYMSMLLSQFIPPSPSPLCPQVQALLLHFYSCPANRLIRTYDGILLSHKKEQHWVICSDVDERILCHTAWSKPEREKQIPHINACIWKLP